VKTSRKLCPSLSDEMHRNRHTKTPAFKLLYSGSIDPINKVKSNL
jgi:hypothetical protein